LSLRVRTVKYFNRQLTCYPTYLPEVHELRG
jgi:hypothetical protein